jgi:hypothetical protein
MSTTNDLVLVHVENKPGFYARIEEINPDIKPNWWQVRLLVLTFPLQVFTWILDEHQLDGADFTMGGTPLRLEHVVSPVEEELRQKELLEDQEEQKRKEQLQQIRREGNTPKVVSLLDRRKK